MMTTTTTRGTNQKREKNWYIQPKNNQRQCNNADRARASNERITKRKKLAKQQIKRVLNVEQQQ